MKAVVLTENAVLDYQETELKVYPVKKCKVVDTAGCGDSFLAAWCAAVLRGQTAEDGMTAGTELSSVVAGQAGAFHED